MKDMVLTMPVVALRGMTILPGMIAHFDISRDKSLRAVEESMMDEQRIFLVTQKNVEQNNPGKDDLYKIGIIANIKQVIKLQNNIIRILVEGLDRAELLEFTDKEEYLEGHIFELEMDNDDEEIVPAANEAMVQSIKETFRKYSAVNGKISKEIIGQVDEMTDLDKIINYVSNNMPVGYQEKQKILEAVSLTERYETLLTMLFNEM